MNIQGAYKTPNRLDQNRNTYCHIIIKTSKVLNKERILKAVREKGQVTYKGRPIRITPYIYVKHYILKQKISTERASKYLQKNYRRKLP